jgi:O-antigen biosynthesis protein
MASSWIACRRWQTWSVNDARELGRFWVGNAEREMDGSGKGGGMKFGSHNIDNGDLRRLPSLDDGAAPDVKDSDISDTILSEVMAAPNASPLSVLERPQLEGYITYSEGIVSGWVKHTDSELPLEITVSVDGAICWKGVARRLVSGSEDSTYPGAFGFRILLPEPTAQTEVASRLVQVQTTTGIDIPGSPREFTYGDQFIGYLEVVRIVQGQMFVYGWCIDKRHPSAKIPLTVRYAGQVVLSGETEVARADLNATGFDAPFGGFSLKIDPPDDFEADLLKVYPGRSAFALSYTDDAKLPNQVAPVLEAATVAVQSYGDDEDIIAGTIDQIDEHVVRGWARNSTNPDAMVVLDCFIDGYLFSTTSANRFRPDLAKHFGDHGFHEYRFELTPACLRMYPGKVEVHPRIGKSTIKHKIDNIQHPLKRSRVISPRRSDYMLTYRENAPKAEGYEPFAALIVINRNGAALLERLLQTFGENNSYKNYEFLIIDHGSTDESEAVAERWGKEIAIRWVQRGSNFSFSASNNYGATLTDAPALVFVNNDVAFNSDILHDLLQFLANPAIGCVGIKLLDDSPIGRLDGRTATQHLGVHFDDRNTGISALSFESRWAPPMQCVEQTALEVPVVTAAFMACRRDEFIEIGGFSEAYFYGQEDVDLCLKFAVRGQKIVCANHLSALHLRGFTRAKMDPRFARARNRNINLLQSRFGAWVQKQIQTQRFSRPGFWTSMVPRIAFVVTEATSDTLAGDYFTALELASQLSAHFPCVTGFVEVLSDNQYNLADFDVVIAMRDDYDPRRIRKSPPHLLKVAWVRNWFERFADRESAPLFDAVWASSPLACTYLEERLGRKVDLVPIATNVFRFQAGKADPKLQSDYCFTGSYWNLNREIVQMLDPAALPFKFAVFGRGWDKIPHLAPFSRGSLPYSRMPDVYASTRLVIDDANHVTKAWGAVNSRVFDAIAAGALVVTNGKSGADSLFDGVLPTFSTPQELEDLLWLYLGNEERRREKVAELQAIVRGRHTYQQRARTVWDILDRASEKQLRISIKIGAPSQAVKAEWGDYHFAASMKYEFDKLGHTTRIDCLDSWNCQFALADHVVIVLRGLSSYQPKPHQINLMWNISHPDKISDHEYSLYDHVFVASDLHAARLKEFMGDRVSVLLQCTDPRFFNPDLNVEPMPGRMLFVGNSRGELRTVVRDAIAADLPIEIYGGGWDGLIPEKYIKGTNIANTELGKYYASAPVVLNDHWDNMRQAGFISNRVFDVLACGAGLISDPVPGMAALFGELVQTYETPAELARAYEELNFFAAETIAARRQMAENVLQHHTFGVRVKSILETIDRLATARAEAVVCDVMA